MDTMTFEELCDFVASELEQNPKRCFGKIFNKEPYKSSLKLAFPMIIINHHRQNAYTELLKSRNQYPPICKINGCSKYVNYGSTGFRDFCGNVCAANYRSQSSSVMKKRQKTNLKKYGHENPFGSPEIQDKIKQTNLERYGVEYAISNTTIKNKAKNTIIEKYGCKNPFENSDIRDKIKKTHLERYGHENPMMSAIIQKKAKQTNLERYGHENPLSSPDIRNKIKKTNLERYGHETTLLSKKVQEKIKKTNLERYGHENPLSNPDIRNKIKHTNLERFGYDYGLDNPDIRDKIKKTNLEKYGHESPMGNSGVREKIKQTNLERYGHEIPMTNPQIQNKLKQTNLERYGTEHVLGSKDIRNRIKQTNLERYGTEHAQQSHLNNLHILKDSILLEKAINEYRTAGVAELCNCDISTIHRYAQEYNIALPTYPNSYWETELVEYLDSLNISYELNTRKIISPYELDFYLPDYNLAIELNGTYWHSDKFKDKNYHYDKWKSCHDQGIQLIQIWDTDWKKTKDIWKSRLSYLTGKSTKTIYARKCSIEIISAKQARSFYDQNHLQGFTGASQHLGLVHDAIPLAMMSFGKTRATKSGEIELVRFCSKMEYQITGAASKLLKAYQKQNPHTIISFSDNMYSDGGLYELLGFTKEYDLSPDYSYMQNNQRYHKQTFTKSSIQKKFGISDDDIKTKTEYEWMGEFGYVRIWDAGKIKWILNQN